MASPAPEKTPDLPTSVGNWADAIKKIVGAMVAVGPVVAAGAAWASEAVSTVPIHLLLAGMCLLLALGVGSVALGLLLTYRSKYGWGTFLLVAGVANAGVGVFSWYALPPAPKWDVLQVPYERTVMGDTPLVQIKEELIPPGFPGHSHYKELLTTKRGDRDVVQQYVVYESTEFTANRFPTRISARASDEVAVAAYIFQRASGPKSHWDVVRRGFDKISGELQFDRPKAGYTKFAMAIVVFPLNDQRARDLGGSVERFVHIEGATLNLQLGEPQ